MTNLPLKIWRYANCYRDLAFGPRPKGVQAVVDYCVDRPILIGQVRSEIVQLGEILQKLRPKCSLEIGTNYGGTLLLLCEVSAANANIISVDLPAGPFGGGYPRRKIPLFRKFARRGQRLHLLRADSHSPATKQQVLELLGGEPLDYLFLDADHTYSGVKHDFQMYSPLVRSGGIVAFHDIITYDHTAKCEVAKFWAEIKQEYRHQQIVDVPGAALAPIAVTGAVMETAGIGLLFMP